MRPTTSYGSVSDTLIPVSELNRAVRSTLESAFPLLWVSGEISNFTRAASGHLYFTLKDDQAQVRCAMFRHRAALVPWQLSAGQRVEARVLVTLYEPRGEYQLTVESVRRAGIGSLYEAFVRLKGKLAREGLFDEERKRALPRYPLHIGIVTSPQAAALHDILAVFARRAPHARLTLFPSPVQGEAAPALLHQALRTAQEAEQCDVIILARGGGSLEDLWAFNDEDLARAIATCSVPVISGVGHETDFSITDLAADLRAATPTAAAEVASAGWVEAKQSLPAFAAQLQRAITRSLDDRAQRLDQLARGLVSPSARLAGLRRQLGYEAGRLQGALSTRLGLGRNRLTSVGWRLKGARPDVAAHDRRLDMLASRLGQAVAAQLRPRQMALDQLATALTSLNPEEVLRRGYAIVRDAHGHIVTRAEQLQPAAAIRIQFAAGEALARVEPRTR